MIVTIAVPSRRQSDGATVVWTPSTSAIVAATLAGLPERTRASNGDSGPVPRPESFSCSRPTRACPFWASESACGSPSWICEAARMSAARTAVEALAAIQRCRTTIRAQADQARLALWSRFERGRSSHGPTVASTTGRRVLATATLTSAIKSPAIPMLRRAGIGRASSASSEIATVVPLKTTEEPACFIALRTAISFATSPPVAPRASGRRRGARSRSRSRARSARRGTGRSRRRP